MQIPAIGYKVELNLWIALSMALYSLGANLAWRYRRPKSGLFGRWAERAKGWVYTPWLLQALRFSFYIGIPYLALLQGIALPSLMGLTNLSWFESIGLGSALGLGAFLLLAFIWWHHLRSLASWPFRREHSLHLTLDWRKLLQETIYQEVHWAFYRSGPTLLSDHYTGVFLGFLLVSLEWWADPAWRSSLTRPGQAEGVFMRWSMAFVMALIFLFVRNLWLVLPIHFALSCGLLKMQAALLDQEGQNN